MSLQSTSTAIGLARDLADKLSLRLKAGVNTVSQQLDSNGWPMIMCSVGGNVTESHAVIAIRIKGIDIGAQDIFGNSSIPFAPHVAQIAFELASTGAPIPTTADIITCVYEVSRLGVKVQELAIANGIAVTQASMDAASPVVTLDSIEWPNKGA